MAVTEGSSPRLDLAKLKDLDLRRAVISYDRASDTLIVHLYGRGRPAVSVPSPRPLARDFVFLRLDPKTDELVGIQVEDVLRLYAADHPEVLDLLERAELRGITREELARIRERLGADERRHRAAIDSLLQEFVLPS